MQVVACHNMWSLTSSGRCYNDALIVLTMHACFRRPVTCLAAVMKPAQILTFIGDAAQGSALVILENGQAGMYTTS